MVITASTTLAMTAALLPLAASITALNLYGQVGLIALVDLIAKHGI